MVAALRAAEGGGYIFSKSSGGGIFKIFPARGYTPYPPYSRPLLLSIRYRRDSNSIFLSRNYQLFLF